MAQVAPLTSTYVPGLVAEKLAKPLLHVVFGVQGFVAVDVVVVEVVVVVTCALAPVFAAIAAAATFQTNVDAFILRVGRWMKRVTGLQKSDSRHERLKERRERPRREGLSGYC